MSDSTLALRLAGPLQSWGTSSQFNRRATDDRPSKAGVVGLLAAAQGRPRGASLQDLTDLSFGVRVDQPGSLMHDYHTVSTLDGGPLLSARVNAKGWQVTTSPKKLTHVTRRSYLQDAVFLALVSGPNGFLETLREALLRPKFFLALGRRSCPPTPPLLLDSPDGGLWLGTPKTLLHEIPWQAGVVAKAKVRTPNVTLAATYDDALGGDIAADVPVTFDHRGRSYTSRRVSHEWVVLPTGRESPTTSQPHDPFELLGW